MAEGLIDKIRHSSESRNPSPNGQYAASFLFAQRRKGAKKLLCVFASLREQNRLKEWVMDSGFRRNVKALRVRAIRT